MPISDPVPAPEYTGLRGKDLKNRPVILRPEAYAEDIGQDGKPWKYVTCDVWVLDRAGVEQQATGVRISWTYAVGQLKQQMGQLVACRPVEGESNAVELQPLQGDARIVAEKVAGEIEAEASGLAGQVFGTTTNDDEEPF